MFTIRRIAPFGAALLVVSVVGCSDPYAGRMEVSGSASLKGKPLPDGAIVTFIPQDNQGTEGQAVFNGGKYTIPRQNGLKPGKYLVRLTAGDGKTAVNPINPDEPPGPGGNRGSTNIISKELIPPAWGRDSKQFVTVESDKQNAFAFDIPQRRRSRPAARRGDRVSSRPVTFSSGGVPCDPVHVPRSR